MREVRVRACPHHQKPSEGTWADKTSCMQAMMELCAQLVAEAYDYVAKEEAAQHDTKAEASLFNRQHK